MKKEKVPVFFATDDNYLPFLAISLISIKDNRSKDRDYAIYILNTGLNEDGKNNILKLADKGFTIEFIDVSEKIKGLADRLHLRDYYTSTTYYRLYIAEMFPQYDKALYIDCDTVDVVDVGELYDYDLGDNFIGGMTDQAVSSVEAFRIYVKETLGVDHVHYFNAGVIVMNLKKFRKDDFFGQFVELLGKYKFTVAQDQDYLNVICKGKVKYLPPVWNVMPVAKNGIKNPHLIHYNLTAKPWHHEVDYQEYFWKYAKESDYYDYALNCLKSFTPEMAAKDEECEKSLVALALAEAAREDNYYKKYELGK